MCGRYLITSAPEAFRRLFRYDEQPNFPPRYNVAPTQPIPIVRMAGGKRQFALVRWGLIPPWVKDARNFSLLINARGESVNDKPAFRNAMRRRRCLIPANGFYGWKEEGGRRRPFCVRPKSGEPVALTGLWETWSGPNGEEMETTVIITTNANRELAHLHERMPVVVPADAFDFWLDCSNLDATTAVALFVPAPEGMFEAYEISPAVNRTANDGPELIAPVVAEEAPPVGVEVRASEPTKRKKKPVKDERQSSLF